MKQSHWQKTFFCHECTNDCGKYSCIRGYFSYEPFALDDYAGASAQWLGGSTENAEIGLAVSVIIALGRNVAVCPRPISDPGGACASEDPPDAS